MNYETMDKILRYGVRLLGALITGSCFIILATSIIFYLSNMKAPSELWITILSIPGIYAGTLYYRWSFTKDFEGRDIFLMPSKDLEKLFNKLKKFKRNKKIVSPVIATFLLVAIAVAAVGAYFIWFRSFQYESQTQENQGRYIYGPYAVDFSKGKSVSILDNNISLISYDKSWDYIIIKFNDQKLNLTGETKNVSNELQLYHLNVPNPCIGIFSTEEIKDLTTVAEYLRNGIPNEQIILNPFEVYDGLMYMGNKKCSYLGVQCSCYNTTYDFGHEAINIKGTMYRIDYSKDTNYYEKDKMILTKLSEEN